MQTIFPVFRRNIEWRRAGIVCVKKTSWVYRGDRTWACYCHCDDCRRNCAAPVVAWFGVPVENFAWTGDKPRIYESSKGVFRHFCGTCGSPVAFEADHYPGGINLYAASLEDPQDFKPSFHVNKQSQLAWLQMNDELDAYEGTLLNTPNDPGGYQ
ncbi:MAG: GFA family protein [Rhodobacteraceae bacterium]|nr:GFA family protein [Paracoccaceae bacterium]